METCKSLTLETFSVGNAYLIFWGISKKGKMTFASDSFFFMQQQTLDATQKGQDQMIGLFSIKKVVHTRFDFRNMFKHWVAIPFRCVSRTTRSPFTQNF